MMPIIVSFISAQMVRAMVNLVDMSNVHRGVRSKFCIRSMPTDLPHSRVLDDRFGHLDALWPATNKLLTRRLRPGCGVW